jgi:type III pantothenate kinase
MAVNLVLDIGNSRNKVAVFEGSELVEKVVFTSGDLSAVVNLVEKYKPQFSMISSVGVNGDAYKSYLQSHTIGFELTPQLPLPFQNKYATPLTLGMDRLAGIAGSRCFFPDKACLVIDLGTCVTYDFISVQHDYLGGAIAPGLKMRLQAMAYYTKRLPDIAFQLPPSFIGDSTQNSMLSGAFYGLLGEINACHGRYEEQFGTVQVILCGGDAELFDKHTKKSIFAAPDLVLIGLNQLLRYNAK